VTDLNGDGRGDVATTDSFYESTSVLLNDGTGLLAAPTTYPPELINGYLNEVAITAGDVNGDGRVDLVVANRTGKDAGVYFGHGDGTFDREQLRYGMHTDLTDIALADMNGNGHLDAIGPTDPESVDGSAATVASAGSGGISVLLNGAGMNARSTLTVTLVGRGRGIVSSSPAGIACGTDCSESFAAGARVTLTATPSHGSTFVEWSGACTVRRLRTNTGTATGVEWVLRVPAVGSRKEVWYVHRGWHDRPDPCDRSDHLPRSSPLGDSVKRPRPPPRPRKPNARAKHQKGSKSVDADSPDPAAGDTPVNRGFLSDRPERRTFESVFARLVATAGVVGVGTALGAILVAADVAGWITGLAVSIVSVALAAMLWRSRQL
jgi:FG-GAP-like repeat/Divergent InlB B-repeat domain